MARPQKEPLRPLAAEERAGLEALTRAGSERAHRVAPAKVLLTVADGATFAAALRPVGRRPGVAVATPVRCFNAEGLAATPGHGGGPPVMYDAVLRGRLLREFRRPPGRERGGTAIWSLTALQRALRRATEGHRR